MPNDDKKPASGSNEPAPEPATPAATVQEDDSLDQPSSNVEQPKDEAQAAAAPTKKGIRSKVPFLNNMYLIVFGVMLISAGAVVYISLKSVKPGSTTTQLGKLTDQQLSSLKGSTTLVGDSKQTLDVQSNALFEGQVLLRSDLNVAGALKIGGGLSLPSISVGGAATVGQLGISGGLNVAGDTSLQGNLAVQKNLTVGGTASFGSLSVSTLNLTSLTLHGDFNLNQHLNASGGTPSRSNGTALGGGGTASVSGSDTAGAVTINTGSAPPAGCFVTISFAKSFSGTPHVVISPSNSNTAGLQYYTNRSSGSFSICTANAPSASTNYVFDYIVIN